MRITMAMFGFVLFCSLGRSATYYVPDQFPTIQSAIADASVLNGDTIIVRPDAVHGGPYFENIDFLGKALLVAGELGADKTTIHGDGADHVVTFDHGEGPDAILAGFTITNGSGDAGGGIFCDGASPTIGYNHIAGNKAFRSGGIYCRDSSSLISHNKIYSNEAVDGGGAGFDDCNCKFMNNTVRGNIGYFLGGGILCSGGTTRISGNSVYGNSTKRYGGGITCTNDKTLIEDNIFVNNIVEIYGGGVHLGGDSSALLRNNIIYGNKAYIFGGGVYCRRGSPTIERNIISGNWSATDGGGIYCTLIKPDPMDIVNNTVIKNHAEGEGGGVYCQKSGLATMKNTIVWGNTAVQGQPQIGIEGGAPMAVAYSDVGGGWDGVGNIDDDPLFHDLAGDDYRLSWLSPCINRGKGAGYMGTMDMGALEFLGPHSLSCDVFEIPVQGGTLNLSLDARSENAGGAYLIVAGVSGTTPGFTLTDGTTVMPINWDPVTDLMFSYLNSIICQNFMGTLDGFGQAQAAFHCPPLTGLAGLHFFMAFGMDHPWYFTSNPVELVVVP